MFHDLAYRLKSLFRRKALDHDLDDELRFHLEHEARKYRKRGLPPEEASHRALAVLGGLQQTREACRDARGTRWLEDFAQDIKYGLRIDWRNKWFSALIVIVLALGIGVNTAIFTIVHAEIIKPLPFRDPSRLLTVWDTYLPQFAKIGVSPLELGLWQTQKDLFQEAAWYRYVPLDGNLSTPALEPIAVHADFVSQNFFSMLGVAPLAGRGFGAAEDPSAALLSEHLWRKNFSGDPDIAGKSVRFNDRPITIVGIVPAAGQFPDWADLWLPKGPLLNDELTNPVRHSLGFIARMRPGTNVKRVSDRLVTLSRQLAAEHARTSTGWGIRVSGLQDDLTESVRPALVLLSCAASLLLLVACANVAGLLSSRASARAREIAVRAAVGAGVSRIIRQLLTESLVLALLGGACGLVAAKLALKATLPTAPQLEPAVIWFLLIVSLATGILFGLGPAIQSLRMDIQCILKSGSVTGSGGTTRSALVVVEIALSVMLVVGAGILAKSFLRLMRTDPGFDARGILTLRILAPPAGDPQLLFRRTQQSLLKLPGVRQVAAVNALPLVASRALVSRFNVPGSPLMNPDALPGAQIRLVSPDYFRLMRIPLKSGRAFTEQDLNQSVVIINETMAKRFWPGRDPVGLRFINGAWGPKPNWTTITGVVSDVKQFGLDSEPTFDTYYPGFQGQFLVVRTDADPSILARSVPPALHQVAPEIAVSDMIPMTQIASESARRRRWTMALLAAFATVAFLLALVGIAGVTSWSVARRTKEIGIRMALGAQQTELLMLFLRYGLKLTLVGLMCGIVGSFFLRQILASLVYGVSTADPSIYAAVGTAVFLIAGLACLIPARQAARVDPVATLNQL